MGCHTWYAAPLVPQPTQDEIREDVIEKYSDIVEKLKTYREIAFKRKKATLFQKEAIEDIPELKNPELLSYWIKLNKKIIHKIKNRKAEEAIKKRYATFNDLKLFNNKYYKDVKDFHDGFRVSSYPETILSTYNEFLEFFLNPENSCKIEDWVGKEEILDEKMKSFWNKYPGGIIYFG